MTGSSNAMYCVMRISPRATLRSSYQKRARSRGLLVSDDLLSCHDCQLQDGELLQSSWVWRVFTRAYSGNEVCSTEHEIAARSALSRNTDISSAR